MQFVLFHGSFGNPDENWFPALRKELEINNQKVFAPQFPVDSWDNVTKEGPLLPLKNQNLKNWLKKFDSIYQVIKSKQKLCFIGHSLGPLFILHVVSKYNIRLDCAIFVCPFVRKLHTLWQIDLANESFYKENFDYKKINNLIPLSYAIFTDNDPYVDLKFSNEFVNKLKSIKIMVKNGKHLNAEYGIKSLPLVFELCKTRFGY